MPAFDEQYKQKVDHTKLNELYKRNATKTTFHFNCKIRTRNNSSKSQAVYMNCVSFRFLVYVTFSVSHARTSRRQSTLLSMKITSNEYAISKIKNNCYRIPVFSGNSQWEYLYASPDIHWLRKFAVFMPLRPTCISRETCY